MSAVRTIAPLLLAGAVALSLASFASAQESLSVSVTPPLFQLSISPGESWSSAIKVLNSNPYDVDYYAQVVDFEAEGEGGQGSFTPIIENERDLKLTLASWIEISAEPTEVPKGTSREIPFTVHIPEGAPPGGHYAAILVGTKPPEETEGGSVMKVSSFVSSLLFVRVQGEVREGGRIREFRTLKELYANPQVDFILRFENIGTTHVRPEGEIVIYDMWGKERGKAAVNQKSNFGNVLPKTTRKFEFSWAAEDDAFDIGKYTAIATITYGEEGRQNTTAKAYFWILPIVPIAYTLGVIALFVLVLVWFIRRYIRRALALERTRGAS